MQQRMVLPGRYLLIHAETFQVDILRLHHVAQLRSLPLLLDHAAEGIQLRQRQSRVLNNLSHNHNHRLPSVPYIRMLFTEITLHLDFHIVIIVRNQANPHGNVLITILVQGKKTDQEHCIAFWVTGFLIQKVFHQDQLHIDLLPAQVFEEVFLYLGSSLGTWPCDYGSDINSDQCGLYHLHDSLEAQSHAIHRFWSDHWVCLTGVLGLFACVFGDGWLESCYDEYSRTCSRVYHCEFVAYHCHCFKSDCIL